MVKRALALLLTGALLVGGSGAAGASPSSSRAPALAGTITGFVWQDWSFVFNAATAFERAHPGTKIQVNAIPGVNYFYTLTQLLQSSDTPDFSALPLDATNYPAYLKANALLPIDDVWRTSGLSATALGSVKQDYTAADGHHYLISAGVEPVPLVYYNKAAFKKAGITPPGPAGPSMADWYAMVKKLTAAGYGAAAVPLGQQNEPARIFAPYFINLCGARWVAAVAASPRTAKFTDACAVQALSVVTQWLAQGVLAEGAAAASMQETTADALFESGKVAMLIDGMWAASVVHSSKSNVDFGWFLLPSATARPMRMVISDVDGIGISAKTKNPALAKAFIAYLASDPGIWQHGMPPRTDLSKVPSMVQVEPLVTVAYQHEQQLGTWGDLTQHVSTAVINALDSAIQAELIGKATPAQAAAQVEAGAKAS